MRLYLPEPTHSGFVFNVEWGGGHVPVSISNEAIAADAKTRGVDLSNLCDREAGHLHSHQADFAVMFGEAAFARGPISSARIVPAANGEGVEVEIS